MMKYLKYCLLYLLIASSAIAGTPLPTCNSSSSALQANGNTQQFLCATSFATQAYVAANAVPYTGATGDVNLGTHGIFGSEWGATGSTGALRFDNGAITSDGSGNFTASTSITIPNSGYSALTMTGTGPRFVITDNRNGATTEFINDSAYDGTSFKIYDEYSGYNILATNNNGGVGINQTYPQYALDIYNQGGLNGDIGNSTTGNWSIDSSGNMTLNGLLSLPGWYIDGDNLTDMAGTVNAAWGLFNEQLLLGQAVSFIGSISDTLAIVSDGTDFPLAVYPNGASYITQPMFSIDPSFGSINTQGGITVGNTGSDYISAFLTSYYAPEIDCGTSGSRNMVFGYDPYAARGIFYLDNTAQGVFFRAGGIGIGKIGSDTLASQVLQVPVGNTGVFIDPTFAGTYDTTQALHILGNLRVTGKYTDSSNSAGTSGQHLTTTGTGTAWSWNLPTPSSVALTNQGANIATTTLVSVAGTYRVSYVIECTTAAAGGGGQTLTFGWTDGAGATTTASGVSLASLSRTQGSFNAQLASGNLTYGITNSGGYSTAKYAIYITTERIQ